MNEKRFLKVLLLILLVSVFATTNAAGATQFIQESFPAHTNGSGSSEIAMLLPGATGGISGTVTDGTNPLQGVDVTAYHWNGSEYDVVTSTFTNASGEYDISGLPSGTYRVGFEAYDYINEYYDDALDLNSANDISVTAGSTTSSIDAVLTEWGRISGTVTDGTDPIADINVKVYRHNGSSWEQFSEVFTDALGKYNIGQLPTGTYRVGFFDNINDVFFAEYYDDAASLDSANDISVTVGSTTSSIDAVLVEGGHITGTITNGTTPLQMIQVGVFQWTGSDYDWLKDKYTDASGNYDATGLPTGIYRLRFSDKSMWGGYIYLDEWFDDAPDLENGTDLSVTVGSTISNIDAVLVEGGHVTGTVSDESGNPLSGINVGVYADDGGSWKQASHGTTNALGQYDAGSLQTGNYRVKFTDPSGIYAFEYYDDVPYIDDSADVAVTVGSATPDIDAQLGIAGHVTGTVTDGTIPLSDIQVNVYHWTGSAYDWSYVAYTDVSGNYEMGGLAAGTYRVQFHDSNYVYITEYYDNALDLSSAADISVTAGFTTPGIDAVLAEGGHITGTVTDGTNPLSNIEVEIYHWTGTVYDWSYSTSTDVAGYYDMGGLPTGTYRVQFFDHFNGIYLGEWYDDAPNLDGATDISVTAGSITSGIDAVLAEGGHISGAVTHESNPLYRIQVRVYSWTGADYDWSYSTYTDTAGNYDMSGLPTGIYRVQFFDRFKAIYISEWYDDEPDLDDASDISVTAGLTTPGINAVLAEKKGIITGTVTDGTDPLKGIQVKVYHWTGDDDDWSESTRTDASGNYTIGNLPAGTYRVRFRDTKNDVYITEYYDDAAELKTAKDIIVTPGSTISAIDAVLVECCHITGSVSDGSDPIANIHVYVYRDDDDEWEEFRRSYTDASGNYDTGRLPRGTYRVEFLDYDYVYLTECFDNAPDLESATDIRVRVGATVSGIDAVLVEGGHITGNVTDGTDPLKDIEVTVYYWTGSNYDWSKSTNTDASGKYDVGHLPTGTYRIRFRDIKNEEYVPEYFDNAPDLDGAKDISVTAAATTSGIDAVLVKWGHITGSVTDGSDPLKDIEVTAYHLTGSDYDWSKSTNTNASGNYRMGNLPPGDYWLRFEDLDGNYITEYYDDAPDLDSATDINVTAGATTSDIDAVLSECCHISGSVTDGTDPIKDIDVFVFRYDNDGWEEVRQDKTDVSGNYDVGRLPRGTYRIGFFDNDEYIYLTEYYDNAAGLESATDIRVRLGSTVSGIDAVLVEESHITGNVSDGTNPLKDIEVMVYQWTGSDYDWLNSTFTDTSGNYDMDGLPSGTYRLRFYDNASVYVTEYYDDAPDLDSATDISVTAASTTSGIDAVMEIGAGRISGRVTDGTNPLMDIEVEIYHWTGSHADWSNSMTTDASGNYDMGGLPVGTYRIRFHDSASIYVSEYYDDAPDLESATDVPVTIGTTTSGIDAVLAIGIGNITGNVTDGTDPLQDIEIEVYHWTGAGYDWSKTTTTDASGDYDTGGLIAGTYRLLFHDKTGICISEYYNDAPDLDNAADIRVKAGVTTSGINAILAERDHHLIYLPMSRRN
jgi:5-hydroxyisourate hydrolase-like protein (transthyretin family)